MYVKNTRIGKIIVTGLFSAALLYSGGAMALGEVDSSVESAEESLQSEIDSAASSAASDAASEESSRLSDEASEAESLASEQSSRESSEESRQESAESEALSNAESDDSDEESRQSSVDSAVEDLNAAEAKLMEKKVILAQKEIHLKRVNKLLDCATYLIEQQYNGAESAHKGLDFIAQLQGRVKDKDYAYNDLIRSCRAMKSSYKKAARKNQLAPTMLLAKEQQGYMQQVQSTYGKSNPGLVKIAQTALNPSLVCKKTSGFNLNVGALIAFSVGSEHYVCRTPLGRKYHMAGPSLGAGIGIGVTVDTGVADPNRFTMPLHRCGMVVTSDEATSGALVVGLAETETEDKQLKSNDVSVGAGVSSISRGHMLFKIGGRSNYIKSGLYNMIGLPLSQYYM